MRRNAEGSGGGRVDGDGRACPRLPADDVHEAQRDEARHVVM